MQVTFEHIAVTWVDHEISLAHIYELPVPPRFQDLTKQEQRKIYEIIKFLGMITDPEQLMVLYPVVITTKNADTVIEEDLGRPLEFFSRATEEEASHDILAKAMVLHVRSMITIAKGMADKEEPAVEATNE